MTAMHVVITPDAFAGTMSAGEAAAAIAEGWLRGAPHDTVTTIPLSDGGPGFLDVLASALPAASLIPATVADPLGRPVPAALLLDGSTVYVESAQACGLHLVAVGERDPWGTTTTGVGELMALARDLPGVTRVVIGLGGSATHDGGRGAVEALGGVWPAEIALVIASDVDVALTDAGYFATQKGATEDELPMLSARMDAWAQELEASTGRRVRGKDGAGAAGGLGFGLLALGATRVAGIGLVAEVTDLAAVIEGADLVVTGEGRYDPMSLRGKVCGGVARLSQRAGRACLVLAGSVEVGGREARAHGIDDMRSVALLAGSVEESLRRPAYWLAELAVRSAPQWSPAPH